MIGLTSPLTVIYLSLQFHEQEFVLRTPTGHDSQCNRVNNDPYYSKAYGINSNSVLNKSRFFHVIGGMPPDAMHDVLEGVLHYSVKETLKALMFEKGLFSIDEINKRICPLIMDIITI